MHNLVQGLYFVAQFIHIVEQCKVLFFLLLELTRQPLDVIFCREVLQEDNYEKVVYN